MYDSIKNNEDLYKLFFNEYNKPFKGWDFTYINNRVVTEVLGWDYRSIITPLLSDANYMLDMGTGGGEFLSALQPLPKYTYATESYEPNIPIAKDKLQPLGVVVLGIDDDNSLPIDDNIFDLVINRHESYSPREVFRVLKPGGRFVTQQVGGSNNVDLNELLGASASFGWDQWCLEYASNQLEENGFQLTMMKEAKPITTFFDVGAILYYLKAIPWQIPDFNIDKYFDKLVELKSRIDSEEKLEIRSHRFILMAEKPSK